MNYTIIALFFLRTLSLADNPKEMNQLLEEIKNPGARLSGQYSGKLNYFNTVSGTKLEKILIKNIFKTVYIDYKQGDILAQYLPQTVDATPKSLILLFYKIRLDSNIIQEGIIVARHNPMQIFIVSDNYVFIFNKNYFIETSFLHNISEGTSDINTYSKGNLFAFRHFLYQPLMDIYINITRVINDE